MPVYNLKLIFRDNIVFYSSPSFTAPLTDVNNKGKHLEMPKGMYNGSAVFKFRGKCLQSGVVLLFLTQFIQMRCQNVHNQVLNPTV